MNNLDALKFFCLNLKTCEIALLCFWLKKFGLIALFDLKSDKL